MCILVVDDEILVRMLVTGVLRDAGFQVIEASNASEALHHFDDGLKFHAVITDVEMPGENGYWLVRQARLIRPSVAVLIVSGRPQSPDLPYSVRFLSKPVPAELLLSELQSAIDARPKG